MFCLSSNYTLTCNQNMLLTGEQDQIDLPNFHFNMTKWTDLMKQKESNGENVHHSNHQKLSIWVGNGVLKNKCVQHFVHVNAIMSLCHHKTTKKSMRCAKLLNILNDFIGNTNDLSHSYIFTVFWRRHAWSRCVNMNITINDVSIHRIEEPKTTARSQNKQNHCVKKNILLKPKIQLYQNDILRT